MSMHFRGAGGAPGIAHGQVVQYQLEFATDLPPDADVETALARFANAQATAAGWLRDLAEQFRAEGHTSEADIFDAQSLLIEDEFLSGEVARRVRDEGETLDVALAATTAEMRETMEALDDDYLRERAADMDTLGLEIRKALHGAGETQPFRDLPPSAIIVAADLTPTETAGLRGGSVAGFATAYGGPTGHTAILARSLGIPAVIGLGAGVLAIADNTPLILDGDASLLIAEPDAVERAEYERRVAVQKNAGERRAALRDQPGQFKDGQRIALWANIGSPDEAQTAREYGAEGIGLFRTEFLFLDRTAPPDEMTQYTAYRTTLETMGDRPVVVRTLDIGGDKQIPYLDQPPEANPFLGVRGLRLCMRETALFQTQLRALLRAAVHGDLWVMLPMVATPADLAWGREQLRVAAAALDAEGLPHRADLPLGVMIETPAAAVTADLLARDAAFFSVGSNDLTQYAMAADRGAADFAARYPHDSPAVLRLIALAAASARRAGIPIGVCGELGGVPVIAPLLAAMGINELSMAPAMIPLVKEQLLQTTLANAQQQVQAYDAVMNVAL